MPPTVVFGASGFIGRHLIDSMDPTGVIPASRSRRPALPRGEGGLAWAVADPSRPDSLRAVLVPGCTVINVAYAASAPAAENVALAEALVTACQGAGVGKLIHCSTAVLVGDSPAAVVDESTPCRPTTPYEIAKHRVEQVVLGAEQYFPVYVLRPTAVLGPGGQNLKKLLSTILYGGALAQLATSSLYGRRAMNLVPVRDVVGALLFLGRQAPPPGVYICAADDDPDNRYDRVERILREVARRPRAIPPVPLPVSLLNGILRMTRSGSARMAHRTYSSAKLERAGFSRTDSVANSAREFARAELAQRQ